MDLLTLITIGFGSGVTATLLLGFLCKSILLHWLAKDIEQLRHSMSLATIDHQIRYSKFHERRMDAISSIYREMGNLIGSTSANYATHSFSDKAEEKDVRSQLAEKSYRILYDLVRENRIYLPVKTCEKLQDFTAQLIAINASLKNGGIRDHLDTPDNTDVLREELESEFRRLIGETEYSVYNNRQKST